MNNKKILPWFVIISIIVTSLSIGYSAFSNNMFIDSIKVVVRPVTDIRITNLTIESTEENATSNSEEYNISSISLSTSLANELSTITYKIEITNIGNVEMGLLDISGLPENLDYELTNYTLKDKLCDNDDTSKCSLGSITEFYITIKYQENSYDSTNTDYTFTLNFDFRESYTITYENITNNEYPSEVLNGDNLSINFTSSIPDIIKVYINDISFEDFTYIDGLLTINNITGNITIIGYTKYTITEEDDIAQVIDSLDESGGYIELTADLTLTDSLTIAASGDVTLNLTDSTITNESLENGGKLIIVSGSTNLTITSDDTSSLSSNEIGIYMDTDFTGTVTIDGLNIQTSGDAAVRNSGTGTLIIKNCTITSTEWAGINNNSTGTLEVYTSTITGNNYAIKTDGGGISNIYSGIFTGVSSSIYNSSGTTTIYGGSYNDTSFVNYLKSGYTYNQDDSTGYYIVSE